MSDAPGRYQAVKDVVAGSVGGVFQVMAAMPFDTVKVRMQVQSVANPIYSGPLDCLRQTIAQEGPLALYKGTVSPLVGVGACVAIQFGVLESTKRYLVERRRKREGAGADGDVKLGLGEVAFAGFVAGGVNTVVSSPVEHIRIRMQVQRGAASAAGGGAYSGSVDAFRQVLRQYGWAGVYKGTGATFLRESFGYAGYFAVYEAAKRALTPAPPAGGEADAQPLSVGRVLLAGSLAGFGMWVPIYPVDVIKTKLQAESLSEPLYRTTLRTARAIMAEQGPAGFFRGFAPCMLRSAPVNAVTFLGYELAMKVLG